MADIRPVTPHFAVAPQIEADDVPAIAAEGYTRLIANRPDGEALDQPSLAELRKAAEAAGLEFIAIPFAGRPGEADITKMADAMKTAGPDDRTLAFCRSGTRSVTLWALSEAGRGAITLEEAIASARQAGYNIG